MKSMSVSATGDTWRTRELKPLQGEARRWVVIRNGKPYAIKRTLMPVLECAMYRGYGLVTHEAVFQWAP
jgi:hypothetical protein